MSSCSEPAIAPDDGNPKEAGHARDRVVDTDAIPASDSPASWRTVVVSGATILRGQERRRERQQRVSKPGESSRIKTIETAQIVSRPVSNADQAHRERATRGERRARSRSARSRAPPCAANTRRSAQEDDKKERQRRKRSINDERLDVREGEVAQMEGQRAASATPCVAPTTKAASKMTPPEAGDTNASKPVSALRSARLPVH